MPVTLLQAHIIGSHPRERSGLLIGGPVVANGVDHGRRIDYDTGADGWTGEPLTEVGAATAAATHRYLVSS